MDPEEQRDSITQAMLDAQSNLGSDVMAQGYTDAQLAALSEWNNAPINFGDPSVNIEDRRAIAGGDPTTQQMLNDLNQTALEGQVGYYDPFAEERRLVDPWAYFQGENPGDLGDLMGRTDQENIIQQQQPQVFYGDYGDYGDGSGIPGSYQAPGQGGIRRSRL
jgi:hypothetical protein